MCSTPPFFFRVFSLSLVFLGENSRFVNLGYVHIMNGDHRWILRGSLLLLLIYDHYCATVNTSVKIVNFKPNLPRKELQNHCYLNNRYFIFPTQLTLLRLLNIQI